MVPLNTGVFLTRLPTEGVTCPQEMFETDSEVPLKKPKTRCKGNIKINNCIVSAWSLIPLTQNKGHQPRTRLSTGLPRNRSSVLLSKESRPALGPTHSPRQWVGGFFLW
jgi:hypothetical protein